MIRFGRATAAYGRATGSRKGQKGTELAEFAVVFPLFLALLFALIWVGRALSIYGTITRGAREGARFAAAPSCASCSPANTAPTDAEVVTTINGSLRAASLSPTSITSYSPPQAMTFCTGVAVAACKTTSNIQICRGVQLNNASPPQACGTVVSYAYPVPLTFSMPTAGAWVRVPQITVSTSVQVAQEQ
ncbi:MAG TPA: TadE/TadG family type IV pilus assembly protein [Terriglobales bacterium]|nr:TadE/TadG family type IV pilus assembly protein [Terriglobales bacterium]